MPEPYKLKIIEPLPFLPADERRHALEGAGWHVGRLPAAAITLDLMSDSGGGALSEHQWAGMMLGDEAYAGSRNFATLERTLGDLFCLPHVIPAHQGRAAEAMLVRLILESGMRVVSNRLHGTTAALIRHAEASLHQLPVESGGPFAGNLDLERLDEADCIWVAMTDGAFGQPLALDNLKAIRQWALSRGIPVVVDASRLAENALAIHRQSGIDVRGIARDVASHADYLYLSGKKSGLSTIGGAIAVRDADAFDRLRGLCVVYEGMPGYGGMAGRDMEVLARGLCEAFDADHLGHRAAQLERMAALLAANGVPRIVGAHALFVPVQPFFGSSDGCSALTLAAALYLQSGVRGAVSIVDGNALLRLAVPPRSYDDAQLGWVCGALGELYTQRETLGRLICEGPALPPFEVSLRPEGSFPPGADAPLTLTPYRARGIEPVAKLDRQARERALSEAGYNMAFLASEAVTIDLYTDSGTNAMSTRQWSAMWSAEEAYSGSASFRRFVEEAREVYGYPFVLPTHQGRGAENLLSSAVLSPGQVVLGNMSFVTTESHILRQGARFVDVIEDSAYDLSLDQPWKGNVDLAKLDRAIAEHGPRIAYLNLATTVNGAGGQPVSMANLRAVHERCRARGIPVYFDATRAVENAYFIQRDEPSWQNRPIGEILREIFALGDGATVSGKKDLLVNIGGFLALRDEALFRKAWEISLREIGFPESGGLAYRDLEAMRAGMREMLDDRYLAHRIGQAETLGRWLDDAGIPVLRPTGGHAVFVDALGFMPRLTMRDQPGHALAAALYLRSGARAMRIKTQRLEAGRRVAADLLRLALPRRVYSMAQLREVAEALIALYEDRDRIPGLEVDHEPKALRSTLSRYRPMGSY